MVYGVGFLPVQEGLGHVKYIERSDCQCTSFRNFAQFIR